MLSSTESELEEPASTTKKKLHPPSEFIVTTDFPERRYCVIAIPQTSMNIYSKASIIGSLVKLLRGSPEMNCR
ncbi:hypothetical protein Bca52824_047248 [Brassica carinata]|uniref:Uncharacterized protein n=1 Tax=Brassica carinata TaxID=52824 RepID=A0A8X7REG0_BRACI|nr:hypothetical protein Bca52824_047248 [Brassica carinata]